jgi:hypothetical protein
MKNVKETKPRASVQDRMLLARKEPVQLPDAEYFGNYNFDADLCIKLSKKFYRTLVIFSSNQDAQ